MARTGWAIRFYDVLDFKETFDFTSNFKHYGKRYADDVIVFCGMYGLDDYMIWCMKNNLTGYDFGSVRLDLKLYFNANVSTPFFQEQYSVRDSWYDAGLGMYCLYGITEECATLNTTFAEHGMESLDYGEHRIAPEVLVDVLEKHNIFKVDYQPHPDIKDMVEYEYRQLDLNPGDKVYNFINKIAVENGYEWFVRDGILYIGKELSAIEEYNSTKPFQHGRDHLSESSFGLSVSGATRPMVVMSHIEKVWRCVWAKHIAGKSGGESKGFFVERGSGQINKKLYFESLDGIKEKQNAGLLMNNG